MPLNPAVALGDTGTPGTAQPEHPLIGLATLTTLAFQGVDLTPLAQQSMDRAVRDLGDANALMDLSTILLLRDLKDAGLAMQRHALDVARCYQIGSALPTAIRLLAITTAGDLMTNAPLPFLFENGDVTLTMLYVLPGEGLPQQLPPHDVLFVAISQSDRTSGLLDELSQALAGWRGPLLNTPAGIANTSRARAWQQLAGYCGLVMPATARASRAQLCSLLAGDISLPTLLADGVFPLIIRPVDSHAGNGLERLSNPPDLALYLDSHDAEAFFISRFIDYRSSDGLYRKYRVALIDGRPFAAHMGLSSHWMIHYLNAGMTESAEKRAEEAHFMAHFDAGFGHRHAAALAKVAQRIGLDYLVLDCAETLAGELLVFEMDPGAVVHSMDPDEMFPYKRPAMARLYQAFRALLARAAGPSH